MNMEEKAKITFSPLAEVDLSSDDKLDILTNLQKEMSQRKPRRKFKLGVFPSVASAVVAVAIVAGGVGYESHSIHFTRITTGSNPTPVANQLSGVSDGEIFKLLPKGAQLIASDSNGEVIQPVDLGNDGNTEYAAMYQYSYKGVKQIGAIIVGLKGKNVNTLWQYKGPGVGSSTGLTQPTTLAVKDVLGNGTKDVVFTGQVGAGTKYTEVISWQNDAAKSIFETASNRLDIGRYGALHSKFNRIVTWTLDTGVLYNIQAYGWNSKDKQFEPTSNRSAADYFKNDVIPYYKRLAKSTQGKQVPKMVSFGLAEAYFYVGDYQSAISEINAGLKLSANDFPSNSEFVNLKKQIGQKTKTN